ncbi:MAG: hypothetical protein KGL39_18305 [Patescibacteria group bacterium]|nr:hypothetical protein [Patescibacteria group bacterium]
MAIVVEEQQTQRGSNTVTILTVAAVIVGLFAATYFVFFSPAPLVESVLPGSVSSISQINNVNLDVTPLTDSPVYQMITATSGPGAPSVGTVGRPNPFQPF